MLYTDASIRRKLMAAILLTTSAALIVSCLGFIAYEVFTIHKNLAWSLDTRAEIIAANTSATLAQQNQAASTEVLGVLRDDPRVVSACIYDRAGKIFARYPASAPDNWFPAAPGETGHVFGTSSLASFYPVVKAGQRLGTIYLKSNLSALTDRFPGYAMLSAVILAGSLLVAYLLSRVLQKQILLPIQSLAETARAISDQGNYSVRAVKYGDDELGLLTETFNQMVARIEEQNRVLQQFVAIVESSDDAIISRSLDGTVTSWNAGAEKLFGYTAQEAMGQAFRSLIPPERANEEAEILARISQGLSLDHFETVRLRKDGTPVEIATTISPIKNGQGKVLGISAIAHSITERKRAEEKIHRLNLELEQRVAGRTAELETANQELEAFSYSVSHDLRAPLRAVDGFSRAVEEDYGPKLPERGRHYLRTIRESAQRMGALIDDLLAFSRLSRLPLTRREVNMNELVRLVLAELNAGCGGRKLELRVGELPACQGDPALLKQVWFNLLSNAFKYTGKRELATIGVGCTAGDDGNVYFVRDNGTGFDMQYAAKLFGVFQRLHRVDEFEGTGVGLAIVQRIIHRHGGRVWANSAPDQGATFFFLVNSQ